VCNFHEALGRNRLLPVLITILSVGFGDRTLLLGAARGSAGGTAHNVVARFAIGLGLLVIGSARLRLLGILSSGQFLVVCVDLRSRG